MDDSKIPISMDEIEKVCYAERQQTAGKLGWAHANDPELRSLIEKLRSSKPPPSVVVAHNQEEDELLEILPQQQRDLSKKYHEHGFALAMAAASKTHLDVLIEEVKNASTFFKRFACREVVKQLASDEELGQLILAAAPKVRGYLLHQTIRQKRTLLMDQLFQSLVAKSGMEAAAKIIHGCSSEKVSDLIKDPRMKDHEGVIQWGYICRYHPGVMVDWIESDLNACGPSAEYSRASFVWAKWAKFLNGDPLKQLLYKGQLNDRILALAIQFPGFTMLPPTLQDMDDVQKATIYEAQTTKAARFIPCLCEIVSKNLQHFINTSPGRLFQFLASNVAIRSDFGTSGWTAPPSTLAVFNSTYKVSFAEKMKLLDHILTSSASHSMQSLSRSSLETQILRTSSLAEKLSVKQVEVLGVRCMEHLLVTIPEFPQFVQFPENAPNDPSNLFNTFFYYKSSKSSISKYSVPNFYDGVVSFFEIKWTELKSEQVSAANPTAFFDSWEETCSALLRTLCSSNLARLQKDSSTISSINPLNTKCLKQLLPAYFNKKFISASALLTSKIEAMYLALMRIERERCTLKSDCNSDFIIAVAVITKLLNKNNIYHVFDTVFAIWDKIMVTDPFSQSARMCAWDSPHLNTLFHALLASLRQEASNILDKHDTELCTVDAHFPQNLSNEHFLWAKDWQLRLMFEERPCLSSSFRDYEAVVCPGQCVWYFNEEKTVRSISEDGVWGSFSNDAEDIGLIQNMIPDTLLRVFNQRKVLTSTVFQKLVDSVWSNTVSRLQTMTEVDAQGFFESCTSYSSVGQGKVH